MGALEDDLDYGIKIYRGSIVSNYNNTNGNIEETWRLTNLSHPNQTRRMFDDNLKFLGDIGLLKEFAKKVFNWTVIEPPKDKVFNQLQEELKIWQAHNFPGSESWASLLGIGEELGELCESEDEERFIDAIGDICVYIADYCNSMNLNMTAVKDAEYEQFIKGEFDLFTKIYGKLCHAHLKLIQKIRMNEDHNYNIIKCLSEIMNHINVYSDKSLEEITWQTWLKVRERDWQANRNEAHKI